MTEQLPCGIWVDFDAMTLQRRLRSSRLARAGFNARTIARGHRSDALRHPVLVARFLATTPEVSNWTYDLENADELLALAAGAVGRPAAELLAYGRELETDQGLRQALRDRLAARRDRGSEPHYGKRVILYALVRSIGPVMVAEAGTHDGFGSVVIAAALRRNIAEGRPGRLLTFDVNPDAGWLLSDRDLEIVAQHTGRTVDTLPVHLTDGVDLFIHDSLRTAENEHAEYAIARANARGEAVYLVCDDVNTTDALVELCAEHDVPLTRMKERPARHWWPGNVLGLAQLPATQNCHDPMRPERAG
jgi:predicted O-methyltransferase YrrM